MKSANPRPAAALRSVAPSRGRGQPAARKRHGSAAEATAFESGRWLLLIHQIPPTPNYLRVKIGRRLARIGAVAVKNTVYVLPRSDAAQEDFEWVLREVTSVGGEAVLLAAQLLDGLSDREVEGLFCSARDSDYGAVAEEARSIEKRSPPSESDEQTRRQFEPEVSRLERRMEEIMAIDFFGASGRETAHGLVAALRSRIAPATAPASGVGTTEGTDFRGRTWVTRTGIKVDRMGSAWLIRRFIDVDAQFKFVPSKGYEPEPREVRFDMFEAEFSHEGDRCTFEVMCARFGLDVPGLPALAELIHDIDLKDAKFGRPEAAGLAAQIEGLTSLHQEDEVRLARGSELFDELLAYLAKPRR